MTLLLIDITFDITEALGFIFIFFIDLNYINLSHRVSLIASLVLAIFVFIFFIYLAKRVLVSTSSWARVLARLSLFQFFVLRKIVFLKELVIFEVPGINFLRFQKRLEAYFCFYINNFFYDFFPKI